MQAEPLEHPLSSRSEVQHLSLQSCQSRRECRAAACGDERVLLRWGYGLWGCLPG